MKIVGLISGGKDSIYNLIECTRNQHEIVAVANLKQPVKEIEEIDSYMYQTVGNNVVLGIAECLGLPLYQVEIKGKSESIGELYEENPNDEVEDLYRLLSLVKESHPQLQGVSCGAILSTYQRIRVENVCQRLGLISLSYLWKRDQDELLQEMVESQVNAVLIKVASMGLEPKKHLLKSIKDLYPELKRINAKYGVHICGEGGEYESIVLDCPLFKRKIQLDETKEITHSNDYFVTVAYISIIKFKLIDKSPEEIEFGKQFLQKISDRDTNFNKEFKEVLDNIQFNSQSKSMKIPNIQSLDITNNTKIGNNQQITIDFTKNYFYMRSVSMKPSDSDNCDYTKLLDDLLKKIKDKLNEYKVTLENVLYVFLYINDMSQFSNVNQSYCKHFQSNPASRACIQLSANCNEIIIEFIGAVDRVQKKCLHVQSISNWAPACIGPYSQATQCLKDSTTDQSLTFIAGQIAMVPCDLSLTKSISSDIYSQFETELHQVLLNLYNLMDALSLTFENIIKLTVFLTDIQYSQSVMEYLNEFMENYQVKVLLDCYQIDKLPKSANIEILPVFTPTLVDSKLTKLVINNNIQVSRKVGFINYKIPSHCDNVDNSLNNIIVHLKQDNISMEDIVYIKVYYNTSIENMSIKSFDQFPINKVSLIPVIDIDNNSLFNIELFVDLYNK
ncbi:endoribonuclease L-PSP domain-containing protein [Tieghemostelium lacteum]|uniref:Diphthine--ammonia ligase n=1 Tax=Tieghemostelium lacteum TaxID=361077 RepID=A0A151Z6W8_TIELA|nr:endoribonuclease L-PSP domain-containing protein [Tieghemostelium lacteum]|eukprot:KYQ89711.1 endoribonuclease L-PSP domain-containing protein [Tieghemostelium lacteum]